MCIRWAIVPRAIVFSFTVLLAHSVSMQEPSSELELVGRVKLQDGFLDVDAIGEFSLLQIDARFKQVDPWIPKAVSGQAVGGRSTIEQFNRIEERDDAHAFLQLAPHSDADEDRSALGTQPAIVRRAAQIVSAGNDDGNKAHFLLDGARLDVPQGRGMNVVTMGPACMETRMKIATFDTWGDASASERLEAFLDAVPIGDFVLLAAKDDASERLSPSARRAIKEQLGGVEVDRLTYGDAYALVAAKGDGFAVMERYVSRTEGPSTLNFELPSASMPAWRCWADGLYEQAPRPDGAFYICFSAAVIFYGILAASKLGYFGFEDPLSGKQPCKGC